MRSVRIGEGLEKGSVVEGTFSSLPEGSNRSRLCKD